MSLFEPTELELDVLEMLDGRRDGEWGARVGAALEFLSGAGMCTRGPKFTITDKGRDALEQARPTAP